MKATKCESVGAALICLILALSGRVSACESLHAGSSASVIHHAPRIACIDARPHRSWRTLHRERLGHGRHGEVYKVGPRYFVKQKPHGLRAMGVWVKDSRLSCTVKKHLRAARRAHTHKHSVEKIIVVRAW
jgi:hypothetical protein